MRFGALPHATGFPNRGITVVMEFDELSPRLPAGRQVYFECAGLPVPLAPRCLRCVGLCNLQGSAQRAVWRQDRQGCAVRPVGGAWGLRRLRLGQP